jgi:hypothetical protein
VVQQLKYLKYYAHNPEFRLSFDNRIDRNSQVSIYLRGRKENAKTANIRDITKHIVAAISNASVNASCIIENFVTNQDSMRLAVQVAGFYL